MEAKVLFVDDEPNILLAFQRQQRRFAITTAPGGEQALKVLGEGPPFAVVVSDYRMPGMNGVQFLSRVKQASPDTVRIMLTGQADLAAAAEAVNEGNVFRFLLKPCSSDILGQALDAALEQRRLIHAERELLEKTLSGTVEVLSEILSMVNPGAFGRASRMRRYVRHLSAELNLKDPWQYEVAAMLSQIGCIAVPQEILDKLHLGEALTDAERKVYTAQFQVGHDLLARIPRLESIARMLRHRPAAGQAPIAADPADPVAMGSEMLRIAADFDQSIAIGLSPAAAAAKLRASRQFSPALVAAMERLGDQESEQEVRSVRVAHLQPGMRVTTDVRSKTGLLLLGKGEEITFSVLARLQGFASSATGIVEPLTVVVRR